MSREKMNKEDESSPSSSRSSSPSPPPESKPTVTRVAQPPVSRFKQTSLLIFFALLCWLTYSMGKTLLYAKGKPKIVHASRYSKDYKFRPAASPVVTETLKDGRVRLRGALPEQTPLPPPVVNTPRKARAGKKRNSSGTKSKPRARK